MIKRPSIQWKNPVLSLMICLLSLSHSYGQGQVILEQEAENDYVYAGPGSPGGPFDRENASNKETIWLFEEGGQLSWTVNIPANGTYYLIITYSNDNFGFLDEGSVFVDGDQIATLSFEDTEHPNQITQPTNPAYFGWGWNVFKNTNPISLGQLNPGNVTLSIRLDNSNNGVDLDLLSISSSDVPLPIPPVLVSPEQEAESVALQPLLEWSASASATTYQVQVDDDNEFGSTAVDVSGLTGQEYQVGENLAADTKYFWRVRAVNAIGNSPWSPQSSFTTDSGQSNSIVVIDPIPDQNLEEGFASYIVANLNDVFEDQNGGELTFSLNLSGGLGGEVLSNGDLELSSVPGFTGSSIVTITASNDQTSISDVFTVSVLGTLNDIVYSLGQTTGSPGVVVQIPLMIDLGGNEVCSFGIDISYDHDILTYLGIANGNIFPSTDWFVDDTPGSGTINVSGFSQNSTSLVGNGTLVFLQFQINNIFSNDCASVALGSTSAGNCAGIDMSTSSGANGEVCVVPFVTLAGQVNFFNPQSSSLGTPAQNLPIWLVSSSTGNTVASTSTNSQGEYQFDEAQIGGNYRIVLGAFENEEGLISEAVNVTDAFRVFSGATGQLPFTSLFQTKISDANNSNLVNINDAFIVFNLATGQLTNLSSFGLGTFSFIPSDYSINPNNLSGAPDFIELNNIQQSVSNLDFTIGINGDANGSGISELVGESQEVNWQENVEVIVKSFAGDTINCMIPIVDTMENGLVTVSILLEKEEEIDLGAFEVELYYDATKISFVNNLRGEIIPGANSWFTSLLNHEPGRLLFAGFAISDAPISESGTLVKLNFELKAAYDFDSFTPISLGDLSFGDFNGLDLPSSKESGGIKVGVNAVQEENLRFFRLLGNYPNPCSHYTTLQFQLERTGDVKLEVYSPIGQLLKTATWTQLPTGIHHKELFIDDLSSGVYFYSISSNGYVASSTIQVLK